MVDRFCPGPTEGRGSRRVVLQRAAAEHPRMALHLCGDLLRHDQWSDAAGLRHPLLQDHHRRLITLVHEQLVKQIYFPFVFPFQVFVDPDLESVRKKTEFFSLMFVVIGCVSFVTMFLQVSVYLCCLHS